MNIFFMCVMCPVLDKKEGEKWYGSAGSDCNQEEYAELQAGSGGGGKAGKDPGGGAAGAQRRE